MKRIAIVTGALLLWNAQVYAQNSLQEMCPAADTLCVRMGAAAEITQARVGIGLAGGNPVPGASSTLGIRFGALPRISVAARMTVVSLDIPDVQARGLPGELTSMPRSLNIDASVSIFSGLSLLPTVGGFGSIDLLASYGKLSLSRDEGFVQSPSSWAAGVRVGILRESFTAPGLSVSAMYRSFGDTQFGSTFGPADGPGTFYRLTDAHAWITRATVGKRLLMFGALAGVGYDRYQSTATASHEAEFAVTDDDFSHSRTTVFGNLSWSMLILHIVGEGGFQRGGSEDAFYGSLAIRLAL
jgi:hypothetical protein